MTDYHTHLQRRPCGDCLTAAVYADPDYPGDVLCADCRAASVGLVVGTITEAPEHWRTAHNPPPEPARYLPLQRPSALNPTDATGFYACLVCGMRWPRPDGATAADDARALDIHDWEVHTGDAWLIGPAGGGNNDICRPCAGNTAAGVAPRHEQCFRGRNMPEHFRGARCPCRHSRTPYVPGPDRRTR